MPTSFILALHEIRPSFSSSSWSCELPCGLNCCDSGCIPVFVGSQRWSVVLVPALIIRQLVERRACAMSFEAACPPIDV